MLDFRSLQMATASLAEALDAAKTRSDDMFVRDASIQRFEYTYELCVKSLRHQLEAMSDSPADVGDTETVAPTAPDSTSTMTHCGRLPGRSGTLRP